MSYIDDKITKEDIKNLILEYEDIHDADLDDTILCNVKNLPISTDEAKERGAIVECEE